MKHVVVKAALVACALAGGISVAAAFPDRPVRLIVPFPPGGVTDTAARLVGQQLSTKWGQQVVIDNRPGAGGVIGVDAAARSAPDGYTMLLATNGEITINPAIIAQLRYNSQKDLIPIAMVTNTPFLWSANASTQINSLVELVAAAKAKPGELAYSSAGIGSSSHLATEQFAAATGIKLLHVPYRGGAPAATALVGGDVPISAIALSSVMPVVDTGKIRLLAVTSSKRVSLLPNVQTVMETGVLKDFQSSIWTGLFVPAGTPEPIVAKIEQDLIEVLKDPAVVARLEQVGATAVGMPGAQLRGHIQKEIDELKKLANEAGIKLE